MYEESKYRPLSPWAYFGYTVLFSLPLIGLVMLFVFSFSNKNINRRNFARSYFCALALVLIIAVIIFVLNYIFPAAVKFVSKITKNLFDFSKNTLHL